MRLVQFLSEAGERRVGVVRDEGRSARRCPACAPPTSWRSRRRANAASWLIWSRPRRPRRCLDLSDLLTEGRLLAPLDHPDPAHCLVTGTD